LRALKQEGVTIIFISHKLEEVLALADTITVMRGGRTVATVKPKDVTRRQLAELMVGSELPRPETRESTVRDEVAMSVEGVTVRSKDGRVLLDDVSFDIRRGEVVGIAGVEGNGQRELVEAIMGLAPQVEGTVRLGERDITHWSTRSRRDAGIGYIPEDRTDMGLLLPAALWENTMLGHQTHPPFARGVWIDAGGARDRTRRVVEEFRVATPGVEVPAYALSG